MLNLITNKMYWRHIYTCYQAKLVKIEYEMLKWIQITILCMYYGLWPMLFSRFRLDFSMYCYSYIFGMSLSEPYTSKKFSAVIVYTKATVKIKNASIFG